MPKITQLAGILCVGQNHNQAVENFRRTALGQNLMIYGSANGVGFASQSGADLYNPNGGDELLEEHPDLVEKAEVQSQSSAGDVKAHYTICLDGCGSHIISDSSALVTGCCPSCSADLSEITDERVSQHLSESAEADQQIDHAGLVATGATAEEAQRNFALALSNSHAFTALSGTGSFNAATAPNYNPYTGQAVESAEPQEAPEEFAALSSAGEVEAHIYSCSANCEQPFTVSSDEEPVFCAHCSAALVDEPIESQSGDDDSDIDIIDEDDVEDEADDIEDDEDFDSESGSDDEDDLDEDDLDDEDLDDEDLDEEFDDEDLDEEDEDFDSESSSDDDEEFDDEEFDEDDIDEDDLDEDEDFDSESGSDDDEDLDDDEELEEDDLNFDDEDDIDSESRVVNRTFDSLSTAQAQHGTLDPSLVSLSRATGKVAAVHMYYDGQPIARATFASVSHAVDEETALKTFESDNFIRAVSHSLNSAGVTGTCEAFGFMPYQIEMPVDKLLVAESDARISEATSNVTSTIEDAVEAHKDRFVAALSSAQLGVTKNFWGDVRNPIVDSLVNSLSAAGIKDPRAIVERAFIAHGKDFLTTSLSKALDLMSKSEVAQNEISESIDAAAGTVTAEKAPGVVQQQVVTAPVVQQPSAAQLLTQDDAPVQSQSSASTDSSFEDKLARLRF